MLLDAIEITAGAKSEELLYEFRPALSVRFEVLDWFCCIFVNFLQSDEAMITWFVETGEISPFTGDVYFGS